jgi:hypothetical protein
MVFTPENEQQILNDIANLKDRIITLEVQTRLISPDSILEFKARMVEILKNVDSDVDKLTAQITKEGEKREIVEKTVNDLKLKLGIIIAGITIGINLLFQLILHYITH